MRYSEEEIQRFGANWCKQKHGQAICTQPKGHTDSFHAECSLDGDKTYAFWPNVVTSRRVVLTVDRQEKFQKQILLVLADYKSVRVDVLHSEKWRQEVTQRIMRNLQHVALPSCEVTQNAGQEGEHPCGAEAIGLSADGVSVCKDCEDDDTLKVTQRYE
jgi:hypothetical protein